jgi:hypothetical protein
MPGAPLSGLFGVTFVEVFDDFLDVAATLLGLASDLSCQPSDYLLRASNQVARLFLNFAGDEFCDALYLVFIHVRKVLVDMHWKTLGTPHRVRRSLPIFGAATRVANGV